MHAHLELLLDLFGEMRTGDLRGGGGDELDVLRSELERAAATAASIDQPLDALRLERSHDEIERGTRVPMVFGRLCCAEPWRQILCR